MLSAKYHILFYKIKTIGLEKLSNYVDALLYYARVPAMKATSTQNVILFVGEHLPPRIPRLAKWIKRLSDYQPILLCHKNGYVQQFSDPCFEQIILFRNTYHLKRILKQINHVQLVHGFAPKSQYPNLARMILQKPYVHDMQDVYSIYYPEGSTLGWLQRELPHERDCLTKADGIVACSMEINVALRMLKPKRKPKTLFFPLYCDDDFFQTPDQLITDDEIHVVYAGAVASSQRNKDHYGNTQFEHLIRTLSNQEIHFHIYPSPNLKSFDTSEYEELAKSNPFFHFHPPVAQQDLPAELSQYHFGILPFFKSLTSQSELKIKNATTLKLFNYLEAGIPVIVSKDISYQNWILNRYHVAIDINERTLLHLRDQIKEADYSILKRNVLLSREKLSLKNNFKRLDNFYKSLY